MTVNGEQLSIDVLTDKTIHALLAHYNLAKNRIAIEINGEVIKKSEYDEIILSENDVIEIIHFVGGGA